MSDEQNARTTPSHDQVDRRGFLGTVGALGATAAWTPVHRILAAAAPAGCPAPPDFPEGIELFLQAFENWTGAISIDQLWTCRPESAEDLVTLANWARESGHALRPRGFKHNWSPILVTPDTTCESPVVLVDMVTNMSSMSMASSNPPAVTVGGGTSMDDLLQYLEDRGYGVTSCPAPGDLTIGGVLAIGGHGTGVPASGESRQIGQTYGSMSNRVLSITFVAWDEDTDRYVLRTLDRNDPEIDGVLVSLGRTVVTEVTLRVEANENLRCESYMSISADELFAPAGSGGRTFERFLDESGRVEAIWFPFTQNPWLKVWTITPTKPFWAREVESPYNYPFSDNLSDDVVDLINQILDGSPGLTPTFGSLMWTITNLGLTFDGAWDLWGRSKNVLHYIKPTTLRTNANGYAILTRRDNVQTVLNECMTRYLQLMDAYADEGRYPINGPVEIRVTGLEQANEVDSAGAREPALSALVPRPDRPEWDVAVWLDLLTVPGTPDAGPFYTEFETWLYARYGENADATMRVEWSKGWGYTDDGAWTNAEVMGTRIPESLRTGRPSGADWTAAVRQFDRFDPHGVFMNPFLAQLLVDGSDGACPADLDGDGLVGGGDLTTLLGVWGTADPVADLDGDGTISGGDLTALLGKWGPCPG
ncbi:MAG: FAD-binding protein [Phycisphaerales bacterium]|nr:FAD-binding protein [Phycisphaerales bacterium]